VLLLSPILFLQTVVDTADKDGSFGGFVVLLCLFEPIKIPEDRLEDGYAHDHDFTSAVSFGFAAHLFQSLPVIHQCPTAIP
jgi:hypothetical protein